MYAKLSHRAYLDSGLSPAPIATASYLPAHMVGECAPVSHRYWRRLRANADALVSRLDVATVRV